MKCLGYAFSKNPPLTKQIKCQPSRWVFSTTACCQTSKVELITLLQSNCWFKNWPFIFNHYWTCQIQLMLPLISSYPSHPLYHPSIKPIVMMMVMENPPMQEHISLQRRTKFYTTMMNLFFAPMQTPLHLPQQLSTCFPPNIGHKPTSPFKLISKKHATKANPGASDSYIIPRVLQPSLLTRESW